jgi:hypothetical protein
MASSSARTRACARLAETSETIGRMRGTAASARRTRTTNPSMGAASESAASYPAMVETSRLEG